MRGARAVGAARAARSRPPTPAEPALNTPSTSGSLRKFAAAAPRGRPSAAAAALAETLHVRVAEAVDRLGSSPTVNRLSRGDQVEQLVLERVRVLELVDHHVHEARPCAREGAASGLAAGRAPAARGPRSRARSAALELLVARGVEREQRAQHVGGRAAPPPRRAGREPGRRAPRGTRPPTGP